MFQSLIITLQETLEAALIVCVLLAYLKKTGNGQQNKYVWYGTGLGILVSVALAFVFNTFLGGFEGKTEQIFEGSVMLIAGILLIWMVLWMRKQGTNISSNLQKKVQFDLDRGRYFGLLLLAFMGVVREGIEMVIFLNAIVVEGKGAGVLAGWILGIVGAILIAFALYKGVVKFSLKKFFTIASVFLVLFALGLFVHAYEEFAEASLVPELETFGV
jgi:high-affinity iron transporter